MSFEQDSGPVIKGSLNVIVHKLLQENSRMYGYEITKVVRERTQNRINITEAALYPTLHRMEADGALDVTYEKVDGRIRKYYSLSEVGKKEGLKKVSALADALESLQLLLNSKPQLG